MAATREIRSLTGIRGGAALLVVMYHRFDGVQMLEPVMRVIRHGYIAVDLFFVLSGFVMALTYGNTFGRGWTATSYVTFLIKRLGRIYPVYIVLTFLSAVYIASTGHTVSMRDAVTNVLLIQSWGLAGCIDGPSWSISTEFMAYLLFPIMVAGFLRSRLAGVLCCLTVVGATLILVVTRATPDLNQTDLFRHGPLDVYGAGTIYPLLRCLGGFGLGLVGFRLWSTPAIRGSFGRPYLADATFAVIIALLFVRGSDLALLPLFTLLVVALASGRSVTGWVMGSSFMHWLGLVSYSVYLIHNLVFDLSRDRIFDALEYLHAPHAFTLAPVLTLALTIALAAACFYGIEKPGRDWSRRLLHLRSRQIASEPAAP